MFRHIKITTPPPGIEPGYSATGGDLQSELWGHEYDLECV